MAQAALAAVVQNDTDDKAGAHLPPWGAGTLFAGTQYQNGLRTYGVEHLTGNFKPHLCALGVRRAVGAQEEARLAADGGAEHRIPVLLPLQDRQAERVRPQAPLRSAIGDLLLAASGVENCRGMSWQRSSMTAKASAVTANANDSLMPHARAPGIASCGSTGCAAA